MLIQGHRFPLVWMLDVFCKLGKEGVNQFIVSLLNDVTTDDLINCMLLCLLEDETLIDYLMTRSPGKISI
jgi:hypothetical protein